MRILTVFAFALLAAACEPPCGEVALRTLDGGVPDGADIDGGTNYDPMYCLRVCGNSYNGFPFDSCYVGSPPTGITCRYNSSDGPCRKTD
jgi:hypothetical protein